jgi:hypothetical protein
VVTSGVVVPGFVGMTTAGAVPGVIDALAVLGSELPTPFDAKTVKVYLVPLVKPPKLQEVVELIHLWPSLAVTV